LIVEAPKSLAKYLAYKGSVVVNGVSLTVNRVEDQRQRLQLLDQPDSAHDSGHHAQASGSRQQGQSGD